MSRFFLNRSPQEQPVVVTAVVDEDRGAKRVDGVRPPEVSVTEHRSEWCGEIAIPDERYNTDLCPVWRVSLSPLEQRSYFGHAECCELIEQLFVFPLRRTLPDSLEATEIRTAWSAASRERHPIARASDVKVSRHFDSKKRQMEKINMRDDDGHVWTIYECRRGYSRPYLETDQGFPVLRNDDDTFFVISPQRPIRVHREEIGIKIFAEADLIYFIQRGKRLYSHCISIRNPDEEMPPEIANRFTDLLEVKFNDADDISHLNPEKRPRIPDSGDVRKIFDFVNQTKNGADGYVIHCNRGISRSTAVALGVAYLLTGSEAKARDMVQNARPGALPLKKIVELFDAAFGSNFSTAREKIYGKSIEKVKKDLGISRDEFDRDLEELPPAEGDLDA
jgi:predicted protein tyrosine phosphatase